MWKTPIFKFNVDNFRVFDKRHDFELDPVTFCIGPNNSGKSSIVKFLLFVRDNLVNDYLPLELNFLNTETYFESFSEIQSTNNNDSRLPFGFEFSYKGDSFYPKASIEVEYHGDINDEDIQVTGFDLAPALFSVKYNFGGNVFEFRVQGETLVHFKMDLKEMLEDCRKGVMSVSDLNDKHNLDRIPNDNLDMAINKYNGFSDDEFQKIISYPAFGLYNTYFEKRKDGELNYSVLKLLRSNPKLRLFELCHEDNELSKAVDASNSDYLFKLEQEEIHRLTQNFSQVQFADEFTGLVPMLRVGYNLLRNYQDNLKGKTEIVLDVIKFYLESFLNKKVKDDLGPNYFVQPTEFFDFFFTRVLSARELTRTADIGKGLNKIVSIPIERYTNDKYLHLNKGASILSDAARELNRAEIISENYPNKFIKYFGKNDEEAFSTKWLKRFNIGDGLKVLTHENQMASLFVLKDGNKRNIGSMGTGVRQIITLILSPLLFDDLGSLYEDTYSKWKLNDNTIYLEEPESNLHPNWQSLLAELIVDIYDKFNIRFIVETHSEYMIRKLQNLVSEGSADLLQDRIKIIYFRDNEDYEKDQSKDKLKTFEIRIKKDGLLSEGFGPGFYDEAGNLALKLIGNHPLYRN